MKIFLVAAAAAFALAGAASAQPAYDSSQGAAPAEYPKCTQRGQDRCVSGAGMAKKGSKGHKAKKSASSGSSRDGERG